MSWDNFLDITADSYGLSDRQKQVFIARFSDQGMNDSNARIAAKLKLSEQDIERALREVYNLFKDDCLELASRTRGQAEKLRKWLKQKYAQEQQGQSAVIGSVSKPSVINWSAICREQNTKLRRSPTEEGFEPKIFVPLGLMERKQQQRRPLNQEMGMDQVYGVEEKAEVTRKFEHQEFLSYIGLGGKEAENAKNVAIIGEPGAGKTTLLANLAEVIDEKKELAIAISLGSFGAWQSLEPKRNLKDYLEQKWLEDALPDKNVSEADRVALADRIRQGGVWLLLDGLDEMQASSPVEALTRIEQEVRSGYLQKARVVLTCRVNVWDANLSNPLREFETYKTLDFAEGQRDDFIRQWFTKKGNLALGEGLINQLKESGRERICELVKNPLRLVLLCYIWTQQAGELPETKAQFYQRYLPYFYEWKKEVRDLTQDDELQESLHQALAKLALAGIESDSRYRLPRKLARREMGQELFNLAVALGWLNIVDREQGTDEAVYAFFHPTFQEFFAACGVEDWDFFLPRNHVDRPVQGKVYRIFESKWKEVFLLWLGRSDREITNLEKDKFIKKLVNFEDDTCDFYSAKAYLLAASGIAEFRDCLIADQIIDNLITLSFGFFEINAIAPRAKAITPIPDNAKKTLLETDNLRLAPCLKKFLCSLVEKSSLVEKYNENKSSTVFSLITEVAFFLAQIDYTDEYPIDILIDFPNEKTIKYLTIIAQRNPRIIENSRLKDLFENSRNEFWQPAAALIFSEIKRYQQKAIEKLQILRTSVDIDESIREWVSILLSEKNYDNNGINENSQYRFPFVRETNPIKLINIMKSSTNYIHSWGAFTNFKVIVSSSSVEYQLKKKIFICAIQSVKSNFNTNAYQNNTNSLLKSFKSDLESFKSDLECKLLWYCSENLSYPEFYKAWHSQPKIIHPEVLDTTAIGSTALTQTLNLQLLPNELPNYCLDLDLDDQPLNAYTLPELSQELCNLIHQHLNQYPIPSANNLPQLKRHLLPLLTQHPQLTLIFGNTYPSDTLLTFCQQLNATLPIAWINDQTIPNLQTFSPQDPNLLEKILNWLNNAISESL